ncbi:MAG: hypothetical protein ACYTHN_22695 [Planctomycetota bacterium]|jgi:hypothetical protein
MNPEEVKKDEGHEEGSSPPPAFAGKNFNVAACPKCGGPLETEEPKLCLRCRGGF